MKLLNSLALPPADVASGRRPIYPRHCERSEAIHGSARRKDGLLRFARNDENDLFVIPGSMLRIAPE
ncbi:MAG TPA: hypothetical protein VK804_14420 [Bradyrhizobium sp.]|uniref:hypothetical protein n=1 Tax=Bradyrhizobium sp. TaxID=376 RepID=UPI002C84D093|nr:hypothetical protein [Bradyrhizobium sp.]HTB01665.1 hypothetical protein [Bradyrhizobium sp.]